MGYQEHNFKAGRQLVRVEHLSHGEIKDIRRVKIEKVYKTGKIITDSTLDRSHSGGRSQFGWNGDFFDQTRQKSSSTPMIHLYPLTKEKTWLRRHEREQEEKAALKLQSELSGKLKSRSLVTTPAKLAEIAEILGDE